jgi:hypothetical protein
VTGRPGEPPLDPWSVVHVAAGLALGLVVRDALLAFVLILGYEVLEAGLRRVKRGGKGLFEYESWPNIWYDVLFGVVGWLFAQGMPALL